MSISSISEDIIQAEHVRTTFRQFPVAIWVHITDAAVVAGLLWYLTDTSRIALAIWFCLILLASVARWGVYRHYQSSDTQESEWRQ